LIQTNHTAPERRLPSSVLNKSFELGSDITSQLKLRTNEIFEGKVLKLLGSGNALLLIKGEKVIAQAHVPLSEGIVLALKVQETSPTPILKLLGVRLSGSNAINISVILSAMKDNIWKLLREDTYHDSLQQAERQQIRELIDDLSKRLFFKSGSDILKTLIEKSGLTWESKILKASMNKTISGDDLSKLIGGDLKGLASRLLGLNQEEGALLRKFVSTIENLQLLNQMGLHQERKIFLPIPIQFPDGLFSLGQLLIHLPRKEKDECGKQSNDKNLFNVTFILDLSNLGPVRVDLAIKGERIEGRFLSAKEKTKSLIEKNLISFIFNLKEMGFTINRMECHLKESSVISQSLVKEIVNEEFNNICLVA
jgi:hypothetical protein